MIKKKYRKQFHIFSWAVTIIIIAIIVLGIINKNYISSTLTSSVEAGGLILLFIFTLILEAVPMPIGPVALVIGAILSGFNPWKVLLIVSVSSTIASLFSYWIGIKLRPILLKFLEKQHIRKYERFFEKYDKWIAIIWPISPIPYLPVVFGILKLDFKYFSWVVLPVRILRYVAVTLFTIEVLPWFV